jgi:hypothetical protein
MEWTEPKNMYQLVQMYAPLFVYQGCFSKLYFLYLITFKTCSDSFIELIELRRPSICENIIFTNNNIGKFYRLGHFY